MRCKKKEAMKKPKKNKRIKGTGFFGLPFSRSPVKLLSAWRKSYTIKKLKNEKKKKLSNDEISNAQKDNFT